MGIRVKRILSVDFDYFFPNSLQYDWGHTENHGPLMAQILWQTRCGASNLMTGEPALEAYVPSIPEGFWGSILKNKPAVFVADSHLMLWKRLSHIQRAHVINLDAHHDCGYQEVNPKASQFTVDCSNWGLIGTLSGKITQLHTVYPTWRETDAEELDLPRLYGLPTSIRYSLPPAAQYDEVFICRSGAWTPPWHDDKFWGLVESLGLPYETLDEVKEPRGMTLEQAQAIATQWKKMLSTLDTSK